MPTPARPWLIAALTGQPLPPSPDPDDVLAAVRDEGVSCLLDRQLAVHPQADAVPEALRQALMEMAREDALDTLAMLAEQRRVLNALQLAGVECLVMKGGALAHWLYAAPHLRLVTDLDILLPGRAAVDALQPLLAEIGYQPMPANPVANEWSFRRPGGPFGYYTIDAHWRLFNRNLLRDAFGFAELQAEAQVLPDCAGARGLSPVHALCNAIGHRALSLPYRHLQGIQHPDSLRWLWDIHALLSILDAADWRRLPGLAREKAWSALLLDAIRRVQAEFGTPVPDAVLAALRMQAVNEPMRMHWFATWPRYQWQECLASDASWHGRLHWLVRRAWPGSAWVRANYGSDAQPLHHAMAQRIMLACRHLWR